MRMGDVSYNGIGTEINLELALKYYQEAERYFYIKLKNGDYFSRKGLKNVIDKQSEVRIKISKTLPDFDWVN